MYIRSVCCCGIPVSTHGFGTKCHLEENIGYPNITQGREKKTKADKHSKVVDSDTDLNSQLGTENCYCDRCTDQLIQYEHCEMWFTCEGIPDQVISFIGECCEFRVHWYCKKCNKPAVHAVRTYSQMSNPIRDEVVSIINKVMTDSLNNAVHNMAQTIDKFQGALTNHGKSIEEKVSSLIN